MSGPDRSRVAPMSRVAAVLADQGRRLDEQDEYARACREGAPGACGHTVQVPPARPGGAVDWLLEHPAKAGPLEAALGRTARDRLAAAVAAGREPGDPQERLDAVMAVLEGRA